MKKLYPILLALSFVLLTACGQSEKKEVSDFYQDTPPVDIALTTNPSDQAEQPANSVSTNTENTMSKFDQTSMPEKGEEIAVIETSLGTIKLKLFPELASRTVENFKGLIAKGYYDGIIFHRVIPGFMIQGGDPTGTGMGGQSFWGGKFEDEISPALSYVRGALAMANAGPNTNGSQFFIVQAENGNDILTRNYSIFGQAFEGLDIVDKIANVDRNGNDKPLTDVVMKKVTLEKY